MRGRECVGTGRGELMGGGRSRGRLLLRVLELARSRHAASVTTHDLPDVSGRFSGGVSFCFRP